MAEKVQEDMECKGVTETGKSENKDEPIEEGRPIPVTKPRNRRNRNQNRPKQNQDSVIEIVSATGTLSLSDASAATSAAQTSKPVQGGGDSRPSPKTPNNRNRSHGNRNTPRSANKSRPAQSKKSAFPGEPCQESFRYWSREEIDAGVTAGTVIKGPLRINPKNFRQCFVPYTNNYIDVYIPWRNRAFNSDIVAVHLVERPLFRVLSEDLEAYLQRIESDLASKLPRSSSEPKCDNPQSPQQYTQNSHMTYCRLCELTKSAIYPELAAAMRQQYPDLTTEQGLPDKFLQPVGSIVGIVEEKHTRIAAGMLERRTDNNKAFALFIPTDRKIPRTDIPVKSCPPGFMNRPQDFSDTMFVCKIKSWHVNEARAKGELIRALGKRSEMEPMTEAVLMEHGINYAEFDEEVINCLPKSLPWRIPAEEYTKRRDFTKECVFSVDPATARDLDDALSCKQIGPDLYEIGVHIADVSYFVTEGSALDRCAASRATSVYMVQRVIPMLPRLLCEQLCSLNPDEPRLTFSVVWHVDSEGNITDEWFGRTVINSCVKLSYQHAQGFIEEPDRKWSREELPPISEGYTVEDIQKRVATLDKIARCMRRKRFENGALRLDQTKLSYTLSKESGYPTGYYVYELKDSNRMIEEYMLLANMAVARKIFKSYPKKAVLRRHPEPQGKQLNDLEVNSKKLGLQIDATNSTTLQDSLQQYKDLTDEQSTGVYQILMQLCVKPMQRAQYFCTGTFEEEEMYRHYALSVPYYTHFTSPIRRYADIMVHRLLAAALGYSSPPSGDTDMIEAEAKHCNEKKDNAKGAGDISIEMFFVSFLRECGPITERAMILAVLDRSIDVVMIRLGYKKRIYTDKLQLAGIPVFDNSSADTPMLTIHWPPLEGAEGSPPEGAERSPPEGAEGSPPEGSHKEMHQILKVLDIIECQLVAGTDLLQFTAVLLHPGLNTNKDNGAVGEVQPNTTSE